MKGFDGMTKFERAVRQSFEEWSDKIDAEMEEAVQRGEIPQHTEEKMRERANKIWELAHKEK